jgi:dihydrofolate reductase
MGKVTASLAISLDGVTTGHNQGLEAPFGEGGGERLHQSMMGWMFEEPEKHEGALAALQAPSAMILGRNMFSPGRGEWDLAWRGWWGEDPPYHAPTFVLTHYPREPLVMEGGTTFFFVTDGPESALAQARAAAGDGDVGIGGGARTVRQYLAAGSIDELNLHVAPLIAGDGERLFDGLPGISLEPFDVSGSEKVTHIRYRVLR